MKKKLIICIPSLRLGGAAKIALNLADFFIEENIEVSIVLTESSFGEEMFKVIPHEVKLICIPQPKLIYGFKSMFKVFWLIKYFLKFKPTSILAVRHNATLVSALAWKLALKPGSFYIREINPINRTLNRNLLMIRLLESAYSSANAVIANSKDVKNALVEKNWIESKKIYAVDNPVITKGFFINAAKSIEDLWLNDLSVPLIITIGRLEPMKDFQSLIKAFKVLKEKLDCRLIIIGEGNERENLEKLIDTFNLNNYVRLTGALENPYPYLKKADLFVLTSKYEGFGNVIVEALSLGKKIVSTNCPGGPAYILNNGEFGRLVKVGEIDEIAAAMLESLRSVSDEEKLIQRGMDFSVSVVGQKYKDIMFSDNYNYE